LQITKSDIRLATGRTHFPHLGDRPQITINSITTTLQVVIIDFADCFHRITAWPVSLYDCKGVERQPSSADVFTYLNETATTFAPFGQRRVVYLVVYIEAARGIVVRWINVPMTVDVWPIFPGVVDNLPLPDAVKLTGNCAA
jgi:hypothetical protein